MAERTQPATRSNLPPAGRRWGRGAQSVVPYLAAAARSRPGESGDAERIDNPVFRQMEVRLAWRDR